MKKIFFIILLLLSLLKTSYAQEDFDHYFNEGKKSYLNKDYDSALSMFQKIEARDVSSGNLYFNIGNCYFRKKQYGDAMLYYEKAKRLIPYDKDLNANIDLINRSYIKDRVEVKRWLFLQALDKVSSLLSMRNWVLVSVILYVVFCLLIMCFLAISGSFRYRIKKIFFSLGVCLCLFILMLSYKFYNESYIKHGVIVESQSNAKSGPGPEFDDLFKIQAGHKVRILGQEQGWMNIKLPNGMEGWVEANNAKEI